MFQNRTLNTFSFIDNMNKDGTPLITIHHHHDLVIAIWFNYYPIRISQNTPEKLDPTSIELKKGTLNWSLYKTPIRGKMGKPQEGENFFWANQWNFILVNFLVSQNSWSFSKLHGAGRDSDEGSSFVLLLQKK